MNKFVHIYLYIYTLLFVKRNQAVALGRAQNVYASVTTGVPQGLYWDRYLHCVFL